MKLFRITLLLVIVVITLCSTTRVLAQQWAWADQTGHNGIELTEAMAIDDQGNVYVVGTFTSAAISFGSHNLFKVSPLFPLTDLFVVKYDPSGNVLWAKSAGGTEDDYALACTALPNGDVCVAGYYRSASITFGSTQLNNLNNPYGDYFIVRYAADGSVVWAKDSNGNSSDAIIGLQSDTEGNIYATGHFTSAEINFGSTQLTNFNAPKMDVFIVKFNGDGNVVWAKSFGGAGDEAGNAIAIDKEGNIFLTGDFSSPFMTLGNINLQNDYPDHHDLFITKLNSAGDFLWAKSAGGVDEDFGLAVQADVSSNVFLGGYFKSPALQFGNKTISNPGNPYGEIYLVKYDTNGNVGWAQSYGSDSSDGLLAMTLGPEGDIYFTGQFSSEQIIFGNTVLDNSNPISQEIIVVHVSAISGIPVSAVSVSNIGDDVGTAIAVSAQKEIYVAGQFTSDELSFGDYDLTNAGISDLFVSKLGELVNIEEQFAINDITLSPNPSHDQVILKCTFPLTDIKITLISSTGHVLRTIQGNDGNEVVLKRDQLPNGVYVVQLLKSNKAIATRKIIFTD